MVSGALSLSSSEFFSPFPHGTGPLSVSREYLALPDGPGRFAQDSSCPALLRIPLCMKILRAGGSHPLRPDFPDGHARLSIATARSYNPGSALTPPVWALPRSLATTGGIIVYFLFLRVLRCFSSPRSPHDQVMMTALWRPGCPIRKSAGQRSFAPYRGLSQLITSFIASVSLGIRHTPLFAFPSRFISRHIRNRRTLSALYFNVVFSTVLLVPICQRSFVL